MSSADDLLKVAVIDAQRLLGDALARLLTSVEGICCTSALSVGRLVGAPHVAIVAAHGPDIDLSAAVATATRAGIGRVVALGAYLDARLVDDLHERGASAVLSTGCSIEELLAAVRGAEAPEAAVLIDQLDLAAEGRATDAGVTARQHEVLRLLAAGRTPQQIARDLGIALSTCRDHLKALRGALDCRTTTELVVVAGQLGLLPELGRPGR